MYSAALSNFDSLPIIPGYTVVESIYLGSRTAVYRAMQDSPQRPVVIKVMRSDYPSFSEVVQFRNQFAIAQNLSASGVVQPLELVPMDNGYALVMEDWGGIALSHYSQERSLDLTEVLAIVLQTAEALHNLAQHRIIHKDIKPANILIHPESKQVRLIDFSIASLLPKEIQKIQSPGEIEGTVGYLAPEQTGRMNRGIDYRADFYALGITMYELLTGKLPFQSTDPLELIHCHIAKLPTPISQVNLAVPEMVCAIARKLMAKNAEDRYQSALGLKYDLEKCLHQWKETGQVETFELGQQDLGDRFLIPEKLYGREAEVRSLLDAFDRTAKGRSELMLVAGSSGIGKTAVVSEVHKPIVRQRGYFIKGKFDQFNRSVPMSAFVIALRDLMVQLLSESDAQLAQWQDKILTAMGKDAQVLIDVIPELEQIIGAQPSVPELAGSAAQNRFNRLFQKFLEVFAQSQHPLVLFLDDLQWSDLASLNLLKLLLNDSQHLLVLGAYRDNEVSPAHPFMQAVAALKQDSKAVTTITLSPLAVEDTNHLVADTLHCDRAIAQPLSELIDRKTKGNPFFTTQFLKSLHEDGHLTFDEAHRHWTCDIAQVNALSTTEDVVEFMSGQLQKLSPAAQQLLKLAACIGNRFDLATLAIISEQSQQETATGLWKLLQQGLILPTSQTYKFFQAEASAADSEHVENPTYRFLHDRVQQAAYYLIPVAARSPVHYKIGQRLLEQSSPTEREERIFDLVNQLNYGISELTSESQSDDAERDRLAQLNQLASQRASAATAYQSAYDYADIGLQLLGADAWRRQYALTLSLHELAAAAASLCGQFEQMETLVDSVIQSVKTPLEQANVYRTKILALASQQQMLVAVETGTRLLSQLGVQLPKSPSGEDAQAAVREVMDLLGDRPVTSLFDLPPMSDPAQLAIQRTAAALMPMCHMARPALYPLVVSLQVKRSIQFGNGPISARGYAGFGCLLIAGSQKIALAEAFGQLAYKMALEPSSKKSRAAALMPIGLLLHHRTAHLRETLSIFQQGYEASIETGEFFITGCSALFFCETAFWCSDSLSLLKSQIQAYQQQLSDYNQHAFLRPLSLCEESVSRLLHPATERTGLSAKETLNREDLDPSAQLTSGLSQMAVSFLLNDKKSAAQQAKNLRELLSHQKINNVSEALFYFYDSLTALATATDQQKEHSAEPPSIQENQTHLEFLAQYAPMNHLHKWQLVEAERARFKGDKSSAIDFYDRAIAGAKANGYLQEEALANELAAKFYLEWDKEAIATIYMHQAYYGYARWEAEAKVQDLETRYPQLLAPILQAQHQPLIDLSASHQRAASLSSVTLYASTHRSSTTSFSKTLDLETVLKASQMLSREIQLDKLLNSLIEIVVEMAGADKASLVLQQDRALEVVVRYFDGEAHPMQPLPVEQALCLPISVVQYVRRTQAQLMLDGAVRDRFFADPYLSQHRPASFLCVPIFNRGEVSAILYLENSVATNAFTSDRVELLSFLCSQVAISLENARLYQQAQTYAQQVEQSQLQTVQSEKMASLGNLVAGVAHEVNNPIGFLNGSIKNAKNHFQDILTHLELYQEHYEPTEAIEDHAEDIDIAFLTEDMVKILDSMKRATDRIKNISTSLRTFSRADTEHTVLANIHEGIDSTILILKYRLKGNDFRPTIKVVQKYGDLPLVNCFPGQLNQVFMNILANAIDVFDEATQTAAFSELSEQPQTLTIQTALAEPQMVEIRISDNGKGMDESVSSRIFDRLYTTKGVGKGTGLGLAIAHQIVADKHGGTLTVSSTPGQGTEFCIRLPLDEVSS